LRCYEPNRELTPRAPIWRNGEFVDVPIVTKGPVPHRSRWEKSPTTFGPVGRVVCTVVAMLFLASATLRSPLQLVFLVPIAVIVLRGVWARGWVTPDDPDPGMRMRDAIPRESPSSWLRDRDELLGSVWLAVICLGLMAGVMYGPAVVKFVCIVSGVVSGIYTAYKAVGDRA
jgi:hypothetical protein